MAEQKTLAITGNFVVAEAFRQCAPDVVAAYPITPQTTIVEEFAKIVAQGRVHTEYVCTESEHSAMSACIGASAAGARVMTATASQGLALMWEELYIASGMRLPIVMANANRALSAPINIHCDHSDVMGARDAGWIVLFAETAQEAYDNTLMAIPIAEDPEVLLPVMTCLDGFITTHSIDRVQVMDDESVKAFVGEYTPQNALLDVDNPVSHGNFAGLGGPYFEFKRAQRMATLLRRQEGIELQLRYASGEVARIVVETDALFDQLLTDVVAVWEEALDGQPEVVAEQPEGGATLPPTVGIGATPKSMPDAASSPQAQGPFSTIATSPLLIAPFITP